MTSDAPFFAAISEGPDGGYAKWVHASDGVRLRVGYWPLDGASETAKGTAKGPTKGTVLLFPGRTEYIEKYGRTASALAEKGLATLAIDWRGQGLADRLDDEKMLGHVGSFADYQLDVQAMLATAKELGAPEPYFLLAHSMGGCIGLRALHEGLPVKAAAFSAPMWGISLAPHMRPIATLLSTVATRFGVGARFAPGTSSETYLLSSPFEDNMLTTDADMWAYMKRQAEAQPELTLAGPSLQWLHEALVECKALAAMPSPAQKTLTFLGTQERIVDALSVKNRMAEWSNGTLRPVLGAEHEVLMEDAATRAQLNSEMAAFFLS